MSANKMSYFKIKHLPEMKKTVVLLTFLFLLNASSEAQTYPEKHWSNNETPAEAGWGEKDRSTFTRYIIDSTNITGLVIVHKGEIILEYGDIAENSYIASCRKSVLSMLFGNPIENGVIDLNKTLEELKIEDISKLLPIEKKATIKDLISARSGVYLKGSNGGDFRRFAPERGEVTPGSYWLYNNWDFNVAGYIFEQETNSTIYDEVESQLAIPLEMEDWDKSLQTKNGDFNVSKFPAYHMWFSTRDMARIGLLMLRKGKWKNKQVIPENWVNEIIKQRTSYVEAQKNVPLLKKDGLDLGYGYMWWLVENTNDYRMKNAYSAQGAIGQNITIYPAIDVVLAYKTKSDYKRRNSIQTQMEVMKKAVGIYKQTEKKSLIDKEKLIAILDTIFRTEHEALALANSLMKEQGADSKEYLIQNEIAHRNHDINEKKITAILDSQGWPVENIIGEQGSLTVCNVLQHSSLEVRMKYLPMMKEAVRKGHLQPRFLVRAEDRIATDNGELQIYGGQMKYYPETKSFNVWPVFDPVNIDKRRMEIGLGPIAEHLMDRFDFKWNLEEQIKRTEEFIRQKNIKKN